MDRRQFITRSLATCSVAALPFSLTLAAKELPVLKLSSNENPLGMSPLARQAAQQALGIAHRYGDSIADALCADIAKVEGVTEQMVTLGNGSTGILEAIMRQQALKGAALVQPSITYGDASRFASSANMMQSHVPMLDLFTTDINALEKASLKTTGPVMVYLVTPNNPTGLITPHKDIEKWVKRAPKNVFFVIDEAYHELVTDSSYKSCVQLIKEGYENLVVTRTFSKVYAMAGMRLGYGIAAESFIQELRKHYSSWSVNVPALEAGRASLKDAEFLSLSRKNNQQAMQVTQKGLTELGLKYIPSQGNFLIHQIPMDLPRYQKVMLSKGIRVGRDMNLGAGWNRLSLGTPEQMKRFIATLTEVLAR